MGWAVLAALVAGVLIGGCAPAGTVSRGTGSSGTANAGTPAWILTAGSVPRLEQAGLPEAVLRADFDHSGTLLLVSSGRRDGLLPLMPMARR